MAALDGDGDLGTRFDASQYAFFGNDVVEEVELGGLEDEEDKSSNIGLLGIDEEFQQSYSGDKFEAEAEGLGSFSDVDDLTSTFSKLNRMVSEPMHSAMDTRARSFPREIDSIPAEWARETGYNMAFPDQHLLDADRALIDANNDQQRWWSHPHPPSSPAMSHLGDSKPLQRTASYPQKEPQHFPTEPIPIPNRHSAFNPLPSAPPFSLSGLMPHGPMPVQYQGSPNMTPPGPTMLPNFINHRGPSPPAMNPNVVPPQMQHLMQSQMYMRPHHSPPHQILNRVDMPSSPDLADPRFRPGYRVRPNHHTRFDNNMGWQQPRFCSRYMTVDEIEHISRMQHALAHGSDPYIDDYYHQACLFKKSSGSGLRHHFCPTLIRDPSTRTRSRDEPHAFLQVEALGRLPFSSIRRPRPLLDVDSSSSSPDTRPTKPLDQEPMLAARITIEDGLCLVLDVDDIDRVLQFNQVPDGGSHLRRKRQALLEEIASSLHLVDPLAPGTGTGSGTSTGNDDFVFLRIVSLPKGRKLLSRYLNLLHTGTSEVVRVVCMAVFRHLRFLFGSMPADLQAAASTKTLAVSLCNCLRGMDLSSLSACLAAVVCSAEQPPLRPIGSPSGDGASLALKTVLERATDLLKSNSADFAAPNRSLWQASFDAFFVLLSKYCTGKYDSIVRYGAGIGVEEVARAISREIPVELLRASLPHTNEAQRRFLVDFAQRSLPITGHGHGGSDTGSVSSASVPS
ncbi:Topoisomerase II-associated protein PAT1 [Rhynchospora pubera]|uniref:Topoisomerase II-associated protein PAT1 n=1 Tax=Rhynchospora pubera TaxID=906938 RepID=A0AAV8G4K7_9POAL|nr:Topoisomerase II-associated protein PAT1 [Rhynchospora pubera]